MKILIIDNAIDRAYWGSSELRHYAVQSPGATVTVRRAPQEDLPTDPKKFDRIVISGSKASAMESAPWISRLHEFLKRGIDQSVPMLGVCYGHQVLVRVLGGDDHVRKADRHELGWTQIERLGESPLFEGLPQKFFTFSRHFDEASKLPPSLKLLAKSEHCAIQAFESVEKPIYGIQFHPERGPVAAQEYFQELKRCGKAKWFLQPNQGKQLYDPKIAEIIFGNFFRRLP